MLFQGKKITCIITYNEKKYSFDLERHKTINDLYNIFTEKIPDKTYPFIIMHCINKNNLVEITNLDTTLLSLEKEKNDQMFFKFIKSFKCPSCLTVCDNEKNYINKYCIECNQYVCSVCSNKKNSKHKSHYLINIDQSNLKDSIKLWNINLNADLSNQITNFNRQLNFINGSNDIKTSLWIENILKKIKYFENILIEIKSKYEDLEHIFKESQDILNKAMSNLTKSEQEIYSDLFSPEKISNKFFSFSDAEKQIQKLKDNFIEINKVKNKVCMIIDIDNIKKYEELFVTVPKSIDDLTKITFLILEDLKIYEEKNEKLLKKESTERKRKNTDTLSNTKLFKTSNHTTLSLNMNNKNIYYLNNERRKTNQSLKIKEMKTFSDNNEDISKNQKLTLIKHPRIFSLIDSKKKTSENVLLKRSKMLNGGESRYTHCDIKLPKLIINDNEKKNNKYLGHISEDFKKDI